MRLFLPLFAAASLSCIAGALAGETVDLEDLVSIPTEIRNSGATPILCQAEIAHWFATDLAVVEPGGSAVLDLRFAARTGTWAVLNSQGEALPVERAWCGVEGRTYETRWTLALDRARPEPVRLDCRAQTSGLDCR